VAEHATILYVYANPNVGNGVFDAFSYAIDQNLAPVISISYGECEAAWPSGDLKVLAELGQQANVQGQTVVAAAGDSGAADCDVSSSPTSPVTIASHGLAVDAPASSPYTTGMGGSEFNEGSGSYWQTSTGSDILTSALSYIPEMAWNDTFSPENTDSELSAGGGGVSTYFTTKPSWQTGTGVPNDGARDVPDLSLNSSPAHDPLLICVEGSCVNGFRNTDQTLTVVGGTSAAAPTFAGIVALINQQMNTPMGQGNVDYALYPLAANSPAGFHDITVGNNIVPCESGSPDCPASNKMGYSAGVGYDQATGLGSVDAYNLVMAWGSSGAGNLPAPTLSAPANGATGVALSPSFNWTAVSGNAGYRIMIASSAAVLPTNPTTITCSSCVVPPATTATNTTSYTPSSPLAAGTYYWEVQAIGTGQGAWSNISSFITTGATLPAPALTTPATGATAVSLPPAFTWSAVTGNAGYRILVSLYQSALPTNPSVGTCGGCTVGVTTTTASYTPSATALNAGTPYYWEVQALSSSSGVYGTWSNISSFTTALAAPTLSAPANGATSVSLPPSFTWSTVAGNSGYQILVSTTQSALPTTASVGTCGGCSIGVTTSGASYTPAASALAGGTTYYWEVQALSSTSGVYGTWSSISTFATGATDFSLSASPSSVTVAPGGSGTSTLTLAPVNNFSATPTFTCAASSALVGVTCSVGTFSATNNTATVTITASSTAISYPALPRNPPFGGWWAVGLALLALLLLALGRWQDAARFVGASGPRPGPNAIRPYGGTISAALPYLRQMAFGAMLAALLLAALSCGGGSSSGGGGGGQTVSPPESGTVTVTGTSTVTGTTTTLTHTATISVSVS
jgi:hypothetical protein